MDLSVLSPTTRGTAAHYVQVILGERGDLGELDNGDIEDLTFKVVDATLVELGISLAPDPSVQPVSEARFLEALETHVYELIEHFNLNPSEL